ncbi:MAG TPA: DinB family protein [Acidobacteriaceae bacterium]
MMETAFEIRTEPLRSHLAALLSSESAHTSFDAAVADLPVDLQGKQVPGAAHTVWQVLEHMRITQRDVLNRIGSADYRPLKFPDEYWPPSAAPRKNESWDASVAAFRADQKSLAEVIARADLFGKSRPGADGALIDDLLMIVDHNAYHLGELVLLRRLLAVWN